MRRLVSLERQAFLPERKAVSVVHCAQVEVFAQRDHALVVAADPFAAKFVDERRESLAMMLLGVDSPSVPVVRLQDVDFPPLLNCSVGGGETGETGPNDDALFFSHGLPPLESAAGPPSARDNSELRLQQAKASFLSVGVYPKPSPVNIN